MGYTAVPGDELITSCCVQGEAINLVLGRRGPLGGRG